MKRGSRIAVADRSGPETTALYDVVLLAGTPRRVTLPLAIDLAAESVIEIDGERWTVADVRSASGRPSQLICIYADE